MAKKKEPNNKRDADEKKKRLIAQRRSEVANLYLQGYNQQTIADRCSCSVATVCLDLKALKGEWQKSAAADIDEKISLELAKLDRVEYEAWQAFAESKETSTTSVTGVSISNTAGDARFLHIIQNCIDKRCKILGIDAPNKLQLTGKDGEAIQVQHRSQAAVSALSKLLAKEGVGLHDEEEEDDE